MYSYNLPCKGHDGCYATIGNSRRICDLKFFKDMILECSKLAFYPIHQLSCIMTAFIYFEAVSSTLGGHAFKNAQKGSKK